MPEIQWTDLPLQLRQHLFDRAKERKISMEDLFALEEWRRHAPEVPSGRWYKDFGSFKLCGEGAYPKTFLIEGAARGRRGGGVIANRRFNHPKQDRRT